MTLPAPILILAAPGLPGQTLAAALGRNPHAYDVPELNLEQSGSIDDLMRELIGIRGMQIMGLMRAVAQLYGGEQTGRSVEMARRWLGARAHLPTARVAQEIVAKIAPRHMVAPVTAAIFDRLTFRQLLRAYPDAIIVRLTAHPLAYGLALTGSPEGEAALMLTGAEDRSVAPALADPQELWLSAETALDAALEGWPAARVVVADAGTLARDPQAALGALAAATGLPADGAALAAMLCPERSPFAGPGPLGAPLAGQIETLAAVASRFGGADDADNGGALRLDGPCPWRPDGAGFRPEVRARARALGYR